METYFWLLIKTTCKNEEMYELEHKFMEICNKTGLVEIR